MFEDKIINYRFIFCFIFQILKRATQTSPNLGTATMCTGNAGIIELMRTVSLCAFSCDVKSVGEVRSMFVSLFA